MIRHRNGFALITVLWLIAMLSSMVALGLAGTRIGQQASSNRMILTRARWAAEACAAIAQARWGDPHFADTIAIDLGRQTRCRWRVVDPTARLNVNTTDREILAHLLGDSLAQALIARRQRAPFVSDSEITAAGQGLLTVDGPGTVNANAAPRRVLLALPGLGPEAVDLLSTARAVGRPVVSLDVLAGALSPPARALALERYAELARLVTFSAPQLLVTGEGWVARGAKPEALVATIELLVVPLPDRVAVIRRRVRA